MNEASEQMEKITHGLIEACDEANANYCKSVDAMVEATTAMSKGYEEFSRKLGTMVQEFMARAMSTGKTMLSAKSIKEIGDLQNEFAKDFFEQWMEGTGRLTEISARVTQEALTPVARQASDAMSQAAQKAQQGSRAA